MNPNPAPTEITRHFQAFLAESGLSRISIKNYVSDIRQFLIWTKISSARIITARHINDYLEAILATKPGATYRRYLASIRHFITFLAIEYRLDLPIFGTSTPINTPSSESKSSLSLVSRFKTYLIKEKKTLATVKNYLSDLNHFLTWSANKPAVGGDEVRALARNINQILIGSALTTYFDHLKTSHTSTSVINRRESSLRKFVQFCLDGNFITHNPFEKNQPPPGINIRPLHIYATNTNKVEQRYPPLGYAPYLNLAILVLATTALGIFGYNQIFKDAPKEQAYPASPVRPNRQLAFQGRPKFFQANP